MKHYNVKFIFEIPGMVKEGSESEIDAYYDARKEFPKFNVNEATVKIETITEAEFKSKRQEIEKLHNK